MNKTRRSFLSSTATAASALALPTFVPSRAFGANDRIALAGIGMGGRGRSDLGGFLNFSEIQAVAACDVVDKHAAQAKAMVDKKYNNSDCLMVTDYRELIHREDIDAVLIGTPDHWHAIMSVDAMMNGKDVYCEKPETLTIREGQIMLDTARRYGRVFSGGSQRVWGDYNRVHRAIYGGVIGEVEEAWVNVGGPSGECHLDPVPVPEGVDWDRWLGPAPYRAFSPGLIRGGFRPYRDYSGGGMTDWGCHGFGGCLFAINKHHTGPVKITPPGDGVERLTYTFKDGVKVYHGGGWGGLLSFKGSDGKIALNDRFTPPNVNIPNYKGRGGILGDLPPRQHRLLAETRTALGSGQGGDPRRSRSRPLDGPSASRTLFPRLIHQTQPSPSLP